MLPPGPGTPVLWQTYRVLSEPDAYTREMRERYGDAVHFHTLLGEGVAVLEAGLARELFAAAPETFEAAPMLQELLGSSAVIAASGAQHKKLRKILNPRFHGAHVKSFLAAMQRAIRAHADGLASAAGTGRVVVMSDFAQALALDVILETVFGASDLDRSVARKVLLEMVHAFSPSLISGNTFHRSWFPPWRRFVRAREGFDQWATGIIRERRARDAAALGQDVLGALLAARYEDGTPMDDAELKDQLLTLLLAGHETSAIAMAWSVYHLLKSPDVLARLRDELDALDTEPSPEVITRQRYLGAVVSETLRIEPIVTDVVRICREPFTLGERWTVPKGQLIAVMLVGILHDPRTFTEPGRFRPERFLESTFSASEFLPFGGGARRCLGAAFAEAELALTVAELASRWELELASTEPERAVRRHLTMGPKHGVRVRVLRPREHPAMGAIVPESSITLESPDNGYSTR